MIGRKSIVALAVLCALVMSAVSVASASATEAVECSKSAETKDKVGAHCLSEGSTKEWGHVKLTSGAHAITGTNANTASETTAAAVSILAGSISGVATELQCTGLSGTGSMENTGTQAKGTGTLSYTGCTVVKPASKGCVVNSGTVTTNELAGESEGAKILGFKPASGETFANIKIESCSVAALNNTFPVTGSIKAAVNGATSTTTEAGVTEQGTLKFGGNKAGLGGALTIKTGSNGLALT